MELTRDLRKILDVGIALTGEKDYNLLLEKILKESMEITNSDAGTIYVREPDGLRFMIMHNNTLNVSQGGRGEVVDLPNVPLKEENICAYAALHKKVINIADVYYSDEFDFKGPKNYDKMTQYRTKSMLVIPLENHEGENLGVIQLINALNEKSEVVSYDKKYEYIIYSIASQAAVTMANMKHMQEMKELFYAMVQAFTTAVDERTPYNANHTKNVANYIGQMIDYINELYEQEKLDVHFNENEKEQIVMAAMLHDIGKLIIPLEVMNKATRLNSNLNRVINHLNLIEAWIRIDYLEGKIEKNVYELEVNFLEEARQLVTKVDVIPFVEDSVLEQIKLLGEKKYQKENGEMVSYLTSDDVENLCIRKGTLTSRERAVIESHVIMTSKILANIPFGKIYENVPMYAGQHHEFVNGSGYPNHLSGEELSIGSRMLAILDIYDSLVSTDRPYKKPMSKEKAILILWEMVKEGKLDGEFVGVWETYVMEHMSE